MYMCTDKHIRQWWDKIVDSKCYTATGRRKWSSQKGNDKSAANGTYCNVSYRVNHADSKECNSEEERNKKVRRTQKLHPLVERAKHTWLQWKFKKKIAMRLVSLEDCFWVPTEIQT